MNTVNDRVRKYRRKLSDGNCGRLEVWLGNNLIEAIRTIADIRIYMFGLLSKMPSWLTSVGMRR